MNKLLLIISLSFITLSSCGKEGWSETDKQTFIDDCVNASNGVENSLEICNCGLEKAMEAYPTKVEAETAMQSMDDKEIMLLYEDCFEDFPIE